MKTSTKSKNGPVLTIPSDGVVEDFAFFRNILDSSTEYSIIGQDLDGKILLWNEGARSMYGYEAAEVMGKVAWSFLNYPEDNQAGKQSGVMTPPYARANGKARLPGSARTAKAFPSGW